MGTAAKINREDTGVAKTGEDRNAQRRSTESFTDLRCISVHIRDAKCGKIQCSTSAAKPIENNAVRIETTVSGDKKKIVCLGTHVYNVHQEDEEPQGDTLDPGLVLTGTKCGSHSVRFMKRCLEFTKVPKIRSW